MNQYCTIYLVRHGESEGNVAGVIQGQIDTPLTATGRNQASRRAQELKSIKFAAAFSSDLLRAKETAEIIASEHRLAVKTTQLIRERYHGRLEGRLWQEIQQELQAEINRRDRLAYPDRAKHRFDDTYESDEEIINRLITFLREVSVAYLDRTILVASHGGIMRALLVHLGFATYQELSTETITNTGYVILRSDGTDFFIDRAIGINKTPP